jgi:hypothetical protein
MLLIYLVVLFNKKFVYVSIQMFIVFLSSLINGVELILSHAMSSCDFS